ncbi:MAG: LysR family transcriptional regulator [Alicyclobacillaceae bacterium]|nr:LysR family transcriptional regulator [Alicyclobacillaceae bacterium]
MDEMYRTFVRIVESQTLVKAAEALHVTQPTLTRHIHQLEQRVGLPLFDRSGKRLTLNRAGELMYEYAKRCIALEERMRDELGQLADPEVGTVLVGAGLTPSIYLLPPVFAEYRLRHPKVKFQVRTGSSRQVCAMLAQREVDIGIVTTVEDGPDWVLTPLIQDDLLLVVSPNHPLATAGPVSMRTVCRHPFVLMREGSGLRRIVSELAAQHGVSLEVAMETDSLESMNRLVQHGVGVAVLPRSSVQDDIAESRLVVVELTEPLPSRTITLVARRGLMPACAAQFAEVLPVLAGLAAERRHPAPTPVHPAAHGGAQNGAKERGGGRRG